MSIRILGVDRIEIAVILEACSQMWFDNRTFSLVDLAMDYVGMGLAQIILATLWQKKNTKNSI